MTRDVDFLITKEYRRFAEFSDACRQYRYIGLCYGPPGVGKTLSARHYAQWDVVEPLLAQGLQPTVPPAVVLECRAMFYTPPVANYPSLLERQVSHDSWSLQHLVEDARVHHLGAKMAEEALAYKRNPELVELLIIDEADRLRMAGLEQMRDIYDRRRIGMVLIGMPGLEKRMARYPQLYSRVGFVHQFRALSVTETRSILEHKWKELGLTLRPDDSADAEAISAITRITGGNFRLIERLFTQVERILVINGLHAISKDVVQAARESLVIGEAN